VCRLKVKTGPPGPAEIEAAINTDRLYAADRLNDYEFDPCVEQLKARIGRGRSPHRLRLNIVGQTLDGDGENALS
jgi:hypothetical protein